MLLICFDDVDDIRSSVAVYAVAETDDVIAIADDDDHDDDDDGHLVDLVDGYAVDGDEDDDDVGDNDDDDNGAMMMIFYIFTLNNCCYVIIVLFVQEYYDLDLNLTRYVYTPSITQNFGSNKLTEVHDFTTGKNQVLLCRYGDPFVPNRA